MKIEKAIEILEMNLKEASKQMPPDCKNALGLGVEALKHCLWARKFHAPDTYPPLPGETNNNHER